MSSFSPLRDRDAWSTIRGYVYQVELTIQRWLELVPPQVLELECGEDIDLASRALTSPVDQRDRLLEQIKHRDSSITLKSSEAIAAIANFIEHRQANPAIELVFQFTTNARIGREKQSPMPDQTRAIEAWEQLRLGDLTNQDAILAGIRQILANARQPRDLHQDTWQRFDRFRQSATNNQLFDLIRRFQWRTNAREARTLSFDLQRQLLKEQYATDPLQAQEQYHRLFWYVFKRLCDSGRKQLTLEELEAQLALPSLSSSDHATLELLKSVSYQLDIRVTSLEQGQQQNEQLINSLSEQFAKAQGINGAIKYVVETPILDPSPLAERPSLREETVQALADVLMNHIWTAIDGSLGSGKTQLAVLLVQYLISQSLCTNCVWIRLRNLTIEQACYRFDQAVTTLVECSHQGNFRSWYSQLCDCLGKNSILVFDDLPQLARGDELESRITQLSRVCRERGIYLLSTSFYPLPQSLQSVLSREILHTTQVPPFTDEEAVELFSAYDAPDTFLASNRVAYLNSLANRHASLLAAIAEYLQRRNWQFTSETFDGLLRGDHTIDVNEETLKHILEKIQDDQSQELLYRLNLIFGSFSTEDMQALAEVAPPVERPRQRLNRLFGVWIQRDADNCWMVSPLVKALGSQDLSISVRKDCHLALGERIVSRELDQFSAFNAIIHFAAAEVFDKAGSLLLLVLKTVEDDETRVDSGLLALWSLQPLPERMSLGIRLLVRGFQTSVCVKRTEPISYLLEDLDYLVEQVGESESGTLMALIAHLISKCSAQVGFPRLNQYFQVAVRFSSAPKRPDGSELPMPDKVPFESLIWAIAGMIQTPQNLEDWMDTLELLTSEQRERAFSSKATEAGCSFVADRLWLLEADKPEAERNWSIVLAATHNLAERSSDLGLELLWACAICSKVVILTDYNNSSDQAVEVAEAALDRASDDPRIQFLLKEILGRQYFFANRHDQAITWLNQALAQPTEAFPLLKLYTLLRLSRVIAAQAPYLAIQHAQQAVNLAQSFEEIPETELVKALGELAIARWVAIDLPAAFDAWDQAGECLLRSRRESNAWKDLFVLYAHITGYFTFLATTGNPPDHTSSGEIYAAPEQGIFLTRNAARVNYYNASLDCFLPSQLASWAEVIGNDERMLVWAMRGIEMTREAQQLLPLTSLGRNVIPHLILENRYSEVLDLAVEIGKILVALPQLAESGRNIQEPGLDIHSVLSLGGNGTQQLTESCATILGVLPIIFHIATIAIRQPELAKDHALELVAVCREVAAICGTQSLWTTVVEIIDQVHLQHSTCTELMSQYQGLRSPNRILPILGLMAAALQENTPLFDVLTVHISIIEQVQKLINAQSSTWRRIILPYFFNYWKTALQQVTFRFSDPQLTATRLYATQNLPINQQAMAILVIIHESLIT